MENNIGDDVGKGSYVDTKLRPLDTQKWRTIEIQSKD